MARPPATNPAPPACGTCGGQLHTTRAGGLVYYTHNPASPTGHTCPEKE